MMPARQTGPAGHDRDLDRLLSQAERLLSARLTILLEAENCTLEQWRVLSILSDGRGHVMAEIADFALLPAPALSSVLDRMAADGLVYRRADNRDRRRVLAYLALAGRDLYERAAAVIAQAEAELASAVGDNGDLSRWLTRLTAALATSAAPVLRPASNPPAPYPRNAPLVPATPHPQPRPGGQ
jgi:DNA-binding MarR family transcriptional regulator